MRFIVLLGVCALVIAADRSALRTRKSWQTNHHHIIDEAAVDRLEEYLFPNRTGLGYVNSGRNLAISKPPFVADNVKCSFCSKTTMPNCWNLDGLMVEETYLPLDTSKKETCAVIESLAERLSKEVFGNGRPFRDSPDCRNMVMQYMCLYYGSNSGQYRNYCQLKEKAQNEGQNEQKFAPRPPCRSFCVQVATVCANDPTFIQTCNRIQCPMADQDSCKSDPAMGPEKIVLAANLGCDVPYYRTPYNAATPAYPFSTAYIGMFVVLLVTFLTW